MARASLGSREGDVVFPSQKAGRREEEVGVGELPGEAAAYA